MPFKTDHKATYLRGSNAYNESDRDPTLGASTWNQHTVVTRVHTDTPGRYDVDMHEPSCDAAHVTPRGDGTDTTVDYRYRGGPHTYVFHVVGKNPDGTYHLKLPVTNVDRAFLRFPPSPDDRDPYKYAPPGWY